MQGAMEEVQAEKLKESEQLAGTRSAWRTGYWAEVDIDFTS